MFIFLITFIIMKCVTSLPVMLFQLLSTSDVVYIAHHVSDGEVCSLVYGVCNFFASDVVSALVDFW